ncbi:hypothetical protein F4779DRAFT_489057 [Xylariaceae sp. FL0662B]|nr:hypothetical protein F4779DRAFT_489057 [Xylariaceae sp. FL0662B]
MASNNSLVWNGCAWLKLIRLLSSNALSWYLPYTCQAGPSCLSAIILGITSLEKQVLMFSIMFSKIHSCNWLWAPLGAYVIVIELRTTGHILMLAKQGTALTLNIVIIFCFHIPNRRVWLPVHRWVSDSMVLDYFRMTLTWVLVFLVGGSMVNACSIRSLNTRV